MVFLKGSRLAAIVIGSLVLLSFQAKAALHYVDTYHLGELSGGHYSYTEINKKLKDTSVSGFFKDKWEFSLAEDSKVSFLLSDVEKYKYGLAFNNLDVLLKATLKPTGEKFGEGTWYTAMLQAGTDYTLKVTGYAIGVKGGIYDLDVKVAPVPLPAAAWLLGSAVVGLFFANRRRSKIA